MNKSRYWKIILILFVIAAIAIGRHYYITSRKGYDTKRILQYGWQGYKFYFVSSDGRVKRPKDADTVSEGQAYGMLRAVWMNDQKTFDQIYRWTEKNLSRKSSYGDHLLAWHWKNGQVQDWMPASDADIDYALSLILAEIRWPNKTPRDLELYGDKAKKILKDILQHLTYMTDSGRLYLSPWILERGIKTESYPVNPSYYSPGHFRLFYNYTGDHRWLKLADTSYFILNTLKSNFEGRKGIGLLPDWASVNNKDAFTRLEGKNDGFGWEAVRIPFRVGLDYFWFNSSQAKEFLSSGLIEFITKEWNKNNAVFCEYSYEGLAKEKKYENPLFYASYYIILLTNESPLAESFLKKIRSYIQAPGERLVYLGKDEYYVNSLAWLSEAFRNRLFILKSR